MTKKEYKEYKKEVNKNINKEKEIEGRKKWTKRWKIYNLRMQLLEAIKRESGVVGY